MIQVHLPTRSLLLRADDPYAIRDALPEGSRSIPSGEFNVAIRHNVASTRVLRNLGFDAPSPIVTYYDWPGRFTPFEHQFTMAEFCTLHRRCFNLSEMGAAKTAASLWAADWLMKQGAIRKCLILAPLSTLERVWEVDIHACLLHRHAAIVHGTREKREKALALDVDFYILNHDGVSIEVIRKAIADRGDIDLLIMDEGHKFRNPNTDKYKALLKLVTDQMRVWWLTGTPCPNSPADVWSQCRIVAPDRVPRYYGAFRRQTMTEVDADRHIWKPRREGFAVAYAAMQPAVRFEKKDCLDLPPVTTESLEADLSAEQKKAFKTMKNQMVMEDQQSGGTVTAVNAADRVNKLRQILCGAIKVGDGVYTVIDHKPRVNVLLEALESANAKAIVIVPFKGIIRALEPEIVKAGYSVGIINGDVPMHLRNKIITNFKETPDPHILLCHPAVMAHGLNLVEADTLVFYAPIFSNDEYRQVIERFNRPGQTRKMTVIRIGAHPLEWRIYAMVDDRDESQSSVLRLYKHIVHGEPSDNGELVAV